MSRGICRRLKKGCGASEAAEGTESAESAERDSGRTKEGGDREGRARFPRKSAETCPTGRNPQADIEF